MSDLHCRGARLLASISLVLLLAACAVTPRPFTEEEWRAHGRADRMAMFDQGAPLERPLTIQEAIRRVLDHNLDARAKMLQEALSLGQLDVDRWDMLPALTANAGYTNRSEPDATKSRTVGGGTSDSFTFSDDRIARTADLTLSWNILDFGVSYYNARQNADRALIATERRRKAVHSLVRETQLAFWRAAVAQLLEERVAQGIREAESALEDVRRSAEAGARNPVEALRLRKTLLETLRQLEATSQELATAKIQLASLINLPPGSDFRIALPEDGVLPLPQFDMPLARMEELAFANNPDIREEGYHSRIAVDETTKVILQLLPGIDVSLGGHYDANSFLDANKWWEYGAKLSWNVFNVLSAPVRIERAGAAEAVAEARRLAIRMAVLAQVHVAWRQYLNAGQQFRRADELWQVESDLEMHSQVRRINDAQSQIDSIVYQTSAIMAELRRYQSYAQVQAALAGIRATIGLDRELMAMIEPTPSEPASDTTVEKSAPAPARSLAAKDPAAASPVETGPALESVQPAAAQRSAWNLPPAVEEAATIVELRNWIASMRVARAVAQ